MTLDKVAARVPVLARIVRATADGDSLLLAYRRPPRFTK